jgi:hypothetical protein
LAIEEDAMAQSKRKGAMRYLLLAIIPQALSKGFEAMGDRAVAEAGIGNGAGAPYYIAALLLTVIALGLCLFALKRFIGRISGKDDSGQKPADIAATFSASDESERRDEAFDPDAALRHYFRPRSPQPGLAGLAKRAFDSP